MRELVTLISVLDRKFDSWDLEQPGKAIRKMEMLGRQGVDTGGSDNVWDRVDPTTLTPPARFDTPDPTLALLKEYRIESPSRQDWFGF